MEKAKLMRDYAGQGYELKPKSEFIPADQLQRNAAGVQKVINNQSTESTARGRS